APDAILIADHSGSIVFVNAELERSFGCTRHELIGKPVEFLIPERFRYSHPGHRSDYAKHPRRRPMGAGLALFARRKDGSEFPVDIMLSPLETPAGSFVLCAIRDDTSRRNVAEALRHSEEHARMLFEFSPDAVLVCDSEGRIREANARVETL